MPKATMTCALLALCCGLAVAGQKDKAAQQKVQTERTQMENPEKNKAVVRQAFDELFSKGRYELVEQLYSPSCLVHNGNKTESLQEAVADGKEWRLAAPDMVMMPDRIDANGDRVTVQWTARGTNTGRGHGLSSTGKPVVIRGNSVFKLANGKIVEVWNDFDEREIFRQVGQTEGGPAANPEQNKEVVRKAFDEVFSKGRYELVDQLYSSDCQVHNGNKTDSLQAALADGKEWRLAAPDMVLTPDKMEAKGDRVNVQWTARGTNTGKGHGLSSSGKRVVMRGNSMFKLANNKIVEVWNNFDEREIFRQVGEKRP